MTPESFGEIRLKYFFMKMQEYFKGQEEDYRFYGEVARMQTAHTVNIHLPVNKKVKATDLWKFPWDDRENEFEAALSEMKKDEFEASYKAFLGLS